MTTTGYASTKLIKELGVKCVIFDEATQIKEHESFLAAEHAEKMILVGD